MLRLAGVRLHPAMRLVIGLAFLAVGLARHGGGKAMMVVGAVLLVWALIDGAGRVLGAASGGRDERGGGRR